MARPHADLKMSFYFDGPEAERDRPSLEYNFNTGEFQVRGFQVGTDPQYWDSNGKIVSLLDLLGAQVFISTGHHLVSFEEPDKRVNLSLGSFALYIGDGQEFRLPREDFKEHRQLDGDPIYEYVFPEVESDLRSLRR